MFTPQFLGNDPIWPDIKKAEAGDLPVNPILFRLLRIGKLARAIRMVTMNSVARPGLCETAVFVRGFLHVFLP